MGALFIEEKSDSKRQRKSERGIQRESERDSEGERERKRERNTACQREREEYVLVVVAQHLPACLRQDDVSSS